MFLEDFKRDIRRNNTKKDAPSLSQKVDQFVVESNKGIEIKNGVAPPRNEQFEISKLNNPGLSLILLEGSLIN